MTMYKMLRCVLVVLVILQASNAFETDSDEDSIEDDILPHHLQKRVMVRKESSHWTGGIVPYTFHNISTLTKKNIRGIYGAMAIYEYFTCLRFVPWTKKVSEELGHVSYLDFRHGGSCFVGRLHHAAQDCSCSHLKSCTHEIGHGLGLHHEQTNFDHHGWIRINWNHLKPKGFSQYNIRSNKTYVSYGYSINSQMHYWKKGFSNNYWGNAYTFTLLIPDLNVAQDPFYMFRDLSMGYKCYDFPQCKNFTMTCENDGYLTLVGGRCKCRCPIGLDPDTGCRTVLRTAINSVTMPRGSYAFPMHKDGCPDQSFTTGSRTHFGKDGMTHSNPFSLKGTFSGKKSEQHFCIHDQDADSSTQWPVGAYCFYRRGGECPKKQKGFYPSFIYFTGEKNEGSTLQSDMSGELPDGIYSSTVTKFEMCCTFNGRHQDPIQLPNDRPFVLVKNGAHCQLVQGMEVSEENYSYSYKTQPIVSDFISAKIDHKKSLLTVNHCVYTPLKKDCGEVITLSDTNREVTFSSDLNDRGDRQCSWLLKGPGEKGIVIMSFEEFEVDCLDKLEVRFAWIGTVGSTYCKKNKPDRPIYSVSDKMMIRWRTRNSSKSSFKAKVRWVPDSESCYDAADKGATYDGKVNFTRWFQPCLPWSEVTHCPHNAFNETFVQGFGPSLGDNYCRNPDDTFMPWCYTNPKNCARNYCDVCNSAKTDKFKELRKCVGDPTCQQELSKVADKKCQPHSIPDGILVSLPKDSYSVGDTATIQCNTSAENQHKITCLTSGQWAAPEFSCTKCPSGFRLYVDKCLRLFEEKKNFKTAEQQCEQFGATLATPSTKGEVEILKSFRNTVQKRYDNKKIWIGLSDRKKEGVFEWVDGSVIPGNSHLWSNKNNYRNQDCVTMYFKGEWNDDWCKEKFPFICQYPRFECPPGFVQHAGRCYQFFKTESTYHEAVGNCSQDGFALASASNDGEKAILNDVRKHQRKKHKESFWIAQKSNPESSDQTCRFIDSHGNFTTETCQKKQSFMCQSPRYVCPRDFKLSGNKCFHAFKSPKSYSNAEQQCKDLDSVLATANIEEDNINLNKLRNSKGLGNQMWIGLKDRNNEGIFVWATGAPYDWNKWAGPVKKMPGHGCVSMNSGGFWLNSDCSRKLPFTCQAPAIDANRWACEDTLPWCGEVLKTKPKMCATDQSFSKVFCRRTCKVCDY